MAFQYQPPTGALSGVSFENQTTTFLDQLQGAISSNTQSLASQLQRIVSLENTVAQLPDMDNVMTLNTVQTVAALKKYTTTTEIESETYFRGRHTLYTKGDEKPEANIWQNYIVGQDASGTSTVSGRLSLIGQCIRTTGENSVVMSVSQPVAGSTLNNTLDMRYPPTGEPYTTINQPRANPADNEIATVKYVKDNAGGAVDLSNYAKLKGNNTYTGLSLFQNGSVEINQRSSMSASAIQLWLRNLNMIEGETFTATTRIGFYDSTSTRIADLVYTWPGNEEDPRKFSLVCSGLDGIASISKEMGLRYRPNAATIAAFAPQPNDTPEDDEIATVQWVKENACVPGSQQINCQGSITGDATYDCMSLPANGTICAKGSNATSITTQGIIIFDQTSNFEQGMYLPPTWTTGVSMHCSKGHSVSVRFTGSAITNGIIYWIPDKGEATTKPMFTLRRV